MGQEDRDRQIGAIAALGERARRALYEYVVSQPEPVGRDQAALGVGIGRPLAAFHLDRLVQEGLLQPSYRRLGDRTGPGAGRPSKLYQRAPTDVSVSLPQRDYELAARLLARAVAASPRERPREVLDRAARELGMTIGREAREHCGRRPGRRRIREAALSLLRDRGFEPYVDAEGVVRLRNCPFHSLAAAEPELVCGMNLSLIRGMTDGLGDDAGGEVVLEPSPALCCVALRGWV
jgi:predicted ArsR family transcriptional regulator